MVVVGFMGCFLDYRMKWLLYHIDKPKEDQKFSNIAANDKN